MAVVISIKGTDKAADINRKKKALKTRVKGFEPKKFLGKIRFGEDPVTYQRRVRDEE